MEPEQIDAETSEEQKKMIEAMQAQHDEVIMETDEAAGSAEGMRNASILDTDVEEDRDATPPNAISDIPDETR